MGSMHADPEQAVTIHEDLRSQASIGIHWGTFSLAYEVSCLFFSFRGEIQLQSILLDSIFRGHN